MLWEAHHNIQEVTPGTIEMYVSKYITKPEKSIRGKPFASQQQAYENLRICGILEAIATLFQKHQVDSTRSCPYMQTTFNPRYRRLLQPHRLPTDPESQKVYCSNLLEKYLNRPHDPLFNNMLYEDYINDYNVSTQEASDKKQQKEKQKHHWIDDLNFVITKNTVQRIGHWKFIYPTKESSEAFYEQRLILSVPLRVDCLNLDGSFKFDPSNETQTYMEECCLRGIIITEEEMKKTIQVATSHGFSRERVMQIVNDILSAGLLSQNFVDEEIIPWLDQHATLNQNTYTYGTVRDNSLIVQSDLIEPAISTEELEALVKTLTPSQFACYNWFQNGITTGQQLLGVVTGSAGTGKSRMLDCLRKSARSLGLTVAVCGTTGVASYLVHGQTLHRYLLIDGEGECRLQRGTVQTLVIEDSDVIFVDEFSMLESNLLALLDINCRRLSKKPALPFGGKHIILFGDPAQLPPVQDPVYRNNLLQLFRPVVLKELIRQKDPTFANLLQRIRLGVITQNDKVILRQRLIRPDAIDLTDVNNIIICSRRYEVEDWNAKIVSALPGEATTYIARDYNPDGSFISRAALQDIQRYCPSRLPDELKIKAGCICFITRNLDVKEGWVNGTRVKVIRCNLDPPFIIVENILDGRRLPLAPIVEPLRYRVGFENKDQGTTRQQFPLRLGHASTVHSLQGCTLTCKVYVNLNHNFFASGQAYVALSRVKVLDQLYLLKTNFEKIFISEYAKRLLQWMTEADILLPNPSTERFPLQDDLDNTLLLREDDEGDTTDEEDCELRTPTKRTSDAVKSKSNKVNQSSGLTYGSPSTDAVAVRKASNAKIAKRTPPKRRLKISKKKKKPAISSNSLSPSPLSKIPTPTIKRRHMLSSNAGTKTQDTSLNSSVGMTFSLSAKYPVSPEQNVPKLAKEAPPPKRLLRTQAIRKKNKRLSSGCSSSSSSISKTSTDIWSPTTYHTINGQKQIKNAKPLKRLQPRTDDSGYYSGLQYSLSDDSVVSPSPGTPKVAKRTPPQPNQNKGMPHTPECSSNLDKLSELFEDISLTPKIKLSKREVQSISNIDDVPTKEYLHQLCQQIYSMYNTSIISLSSNHSFFKRACIFLKYLSNFVNSLFPSDDLLTPVPESVEIVLEFKGVLDLLVSLTNCESYRTITQIGDFIEDNDAKSLLPPCLHGELRPIKVSADGNCYHRSIAVHVFGNTDLYFVNKFLSGYVIISRQSDFERWVPQRYDNYHEEIGRAFKNYQWAGTWQILATSILLQRPIANYSIFREPAFDPEMTAEDLAIHFQNDIQRERSVLGGMHTLTWTEDEETQGAPLFNLYYPYTLRGDNPNHYVPLIKADRGYRPPLPRSNPVARILKRSAQVTR